MTRYRLSLSALAAFVALASATGSVAQTPPQQDETAPKAASSPHQRDTTSTKAKEAPATAETAPSEASSPHQKQATEGKMATAKTKAERDRMMNDCMKKEQQRNSALSAEQVKKTCTDQMKMHEKHETRPQ